MCRECLQDKCPPRCPNYISHSKVLCDVCGQQIEYGETYVMNQDDEIAHYECFYSTGELIRWLGGKIGELEEA